MDERAEIAQLPPLRGTEAVGDGVVVLRLVIDTTGAPEPATVVAGPGSDSAQVTVARELLLATRFRPAYVRSRPVRSLTDVSVEFFRTSSPPVTLRIASDVYGLAELHERPHVTSAPVLSYPADLLLARVAGRVIVEAVIDTTGRVEAASARVVESSDPRFNQAAKDYIGAARFTPGRVAGRAVRVRLQMPVEFKLPTRN